MESIGKTKKIVKDEKQVNLSNWLKETDPWAIVHPEQQINVLALCRQLLFPRLTTDEKQIIKKLAYKYSEKWKAIAPLWDDRLIQEKVRQLARRNTRLYWQWAPTQALRRDLLTLSYLCVDLHNKCFLCGYHKVPFGRARKNGANHNDWIGRKEHKECWLQWKNGFR